MVQSQIREIILILLQIPSWRGARRRARRVEVALRDEDADMEILPWIEEDNFNPSYLTRDIDKMPQRGAKPEWRHNQDYWREKDEIPATDLDGAEFIYDGKMRSASIAAPASQARSA